MNTVPELIEAIQRGEMVVLVDDEDRENEGDLVLAAQHTAAKDINFMAKEARGLICLAMSGKQVDRLQLPLMVGHETNHSPNKTAFTVSIEAATGVTTGISAADRAHTVQVASRPDAVAADVICPGHIFPIRAQSGGVLKRAGHTEGSVDLAVLAGLNPAAVICEVMNDDGTMARLPELTKFAEKHGLKIGTIVDLIDYRLQTETLIEEMALPTHRAQVGEGFEVRVFRSLIDGTEHIALVKGQLTAEPTLVRVQSESLMTDFLSSFLSTEGALSRAAQQIKANGSGVILFLRTHGASELHGSHPMDMKDYGLGAQILRQMGLSQIRLLSNSETRRAALRGYGLEIIETIPY